MGILKNRYMQLHIAILIYTLSSVFSKLASDSLGMNGLFDFKTILMLGGLVFILGLYAIVWQQVIKNIDLSVAYSNKGISIMWTLMWSVILFNEKLQFKNILGAVIIIIGIMVINYDK
ncbi:MAG: EamA family transporter [Clostridium sp.]|uniref:EamA family transporter n=1 Tax=Clostridium sp. TaxID=1506 RepID=UPI0025C33322|nr:EamA family transporter [Clostridium sp.]MCF0147283.1 EamA family transporter [Clostridium sp.]